MNLAARMTLTGINQLWVADITYIRLRHEFVYLAVVIDRYSRKVIGWALDRTLAARVAVAALQTGDCQRQPPPGVVLHSDQGIQYRVRRNSPRVAEHQMVPSMSRPANPYDNAACESFMKTLKQEEIYCHQYRDFEELSAASGRVHGQLLQPATAALGIGVSDAGRVRARHDGCQRGGCHDGVFPSA